MEKISKTTATKILHIFFSPLTTATSRPDADLFPVMIYIYVYSICYIYVICISYIVIVVVVAEPRISMAEKYWETI